MDILLQWLRLPSDSWLAFCLVLLAAFKRDVISQPELHRQESGVQPSQSVFAFFHRVPHGCLRGTESAYVCALVCVHTHTHIHTPNSCATCSLWRRTRPKHLLFGTQTVTACVFLHGIDAFLFKSRLTCEETLLPEDIISTEGQYISKETHLKSECFKRDAFCYKYQHRTRTIYKKQNRWIFFSLFF